MQQISIERVRLDMTECAMLSTENCARNWNLTIRINGICTNKQKTLLENEMHKFLWDFELLTDHLISAILPYLVRPTKKKENLQNCRPHSKIEGERKEW